jgi:hypothetical protein
LEAIERTVQKVSFCPSCCLKGLAYLKILTSKRYPDKSEEYSAMYKEKKYDTLNTERNFEGEVYSLIVKLIT